MKRDDETKLVTKLWRTTPSSRYVKTKNLKIWSLDHPPFSSMNFPWKNPPIFFIKRTRHRLLKNSSDLAIDVVCATEHTHGANLGLLQRANLGKTHGAFAQIIQSSWNPRFEAYSAYGILSWHGDLGILYFLRNHMGSHPPVGEWLKKRGTALTRDTPKRSIAAGNQRSSKDTLSTAASVASYDIYVCIYIYIIDIVLKLSFVRWMLGGSL